MTKDEALKLGLEALEEAWYHVGTFQPTKKAIDLYDEARAVIKETLAQPEQDNTYAYASSLAKTIWQKHYTKESPKFALFDTTEGVLTQIDNMTCGLVREKPAQPEQIMQDSTCSTTLRLQGKPYPRTCKKCGLGPCIAQPSAQPEQEPVAWEQFYPDIGKPQIAEALAKEKALQDLHDENERLGLYKDAYAEQEPMAWISTGLARMIHWTSDKPAYGDDWVPLYTTSPQRKPLTDEQIIASNYPDGEENGPTIAAPDFELICFARQIEAAHGILEQGDKND